MTGAVLAGGDSTRMGINKALLPFGGVRMIEGIIQKIRPLFAEIHIVANEPNPYAYLGLPIVPDQVRGKGPLGGIYSALLYSRSPQTFCVACDMPLVNPAVVAYLRDAAVGYDVVVPKMPDGYQPLHAIYGKACLAPIASMIRGDRLKIDQLFSAVRVRVVTAEELRPMDPDLRCFVNVNTREQLEAELERERKRGGDGLAGRSHA
jgi:molybdopterin-guanine dinucleotide biosynthesis protein A